MMRSHHTNTAFPSRPFAKLLLQHDDEIQFYQMSAPPEIPPGYRPVWRWEGNALLLGIEPISGGAAPVIDTNQNLSLEDLQTKAAMNGIKYSKQTTRADLLTMLKAKGKA